jgi:hypothetical protein
MVEIAKWEHHRNRERARIEWLFTVDRAREKLGRVYPAPSSAAQRRRTCAGAIDTSRARS